MEWLVIPESLLPAVRIFAIVVVAIVIRIAIRLVAKRVINKLRLETENGSAKNQQRLLSRSATLASITNNFATWGIAITAVVMVLSELGVDTGALIAVTTIVGAALGFGGQTLVKDVIAGVFIVFEDQYGVGDRVVLDGIEGVVEAVELRVTQVRDDQGTLWYLRNGEILKVGNASQNRAK